MFLDSTTNGTSQSSYLDYLYSADALNAPWKVPKPAVAKATHPPAPVVPLTPTSPIVPIPTPPITPPEPPRKVQVKTQHKPILPNTVLKPAPPLSVPSLHAHAHSQVLPDQALLNYIHSVPPLFPLGNLGADLHLYMMAVAESAAAAALALGGLSATSNDTSGLVKNKFTLKEVLERSAPITGKDQRICLNCWTADTPLWRRNHLQQFLCNACGLYLKSTGVNRPQKEFKKDEKNLQGVNGSAPNASAVASPICDNCQATETSQWRRDKDNNMLCNACGLYYKMHQKCRPLSSARKSAAKRTRKWNPSAHVLKAMEEAVATSTAAQNSTGALEFISSPMCTSSTDAAASTTGAAASTSTTHTISQGHTQTLTAEEQPVTQPSPVLTPSLSDVSMHQQQPPADASQIQHTWSQSSAMSISNPLTTGYEHQPHTTLYTDMGAPTINTHVSNAGMHGGQASAGPSSVSSPMSSSLDADINETLNTQHLSPGMDPVPADMDSTITHGVVSHHMGTTQSERAHLFETHMDHMTTMNEHAINSMNERIMQASSSNLMDLAHHASAASAPSPFDAVNPHDRYTNSRAQVQANAYHSQNPVSPFSHSVHAIMGGSAVGANSSSPAMAAKKFNAPTNSDNLVSLALSGGLKAPTMYEDSTSANGVASSSENQTEVNTTTSSTYSGKSPVYKHSVTNPSAAASSPYAHPNSQRYGMGTLHVPQPSQLDTSPLDLCLFGIMPRSMPNFTVQAPIVQYDQAQQQQETVGQQQMAENTQTA